jgi:hypothetical protein
MRPLIIIYHYKPSSWNSDQGNKDMCKNSNLVPYFVLLVAGKRKKYASLILTYISQIKPAGYKMEEAFVDWFVLRKNLSQFFEIRFHFPRIYFSKTCVKQGNSEIRKLGLKDEFDSPNI